MRIGADDRSNVDFDTVAAIALAAASLSKEYTQDLSRVLVDGAYGRDYLISLDHKLPNAVKGRINALSGI